jgi:hypothetical protein
MKFLTFYTSEVHYRVQKSPPLVPIQSQINPVHISHLFSLRCIFTLPLVHAYSLWPLRDTEITISPKMDDMTQKTSVNMVAMYR